MQPEQAGLNKEGEVQTEQPEQRPRLLWANVCCLLDTTSGASISVRQMLSQLQRSGYEVHILGATVFDAPGGVKGLGAQWERVKTSSKKLVILHDGPLKHHLVRTASTVRNRMTCEEESTWFAVYRELLHEVKPDLVWYYGGLPLDLLIACEARSLGIPVAFYLVNRNYHQKRFSRDVDLILTDSKATAEMYRERSGLSLVSVGAFIDPGRVVAAAHTRRRVLFINPSLEKGAGIVAQIAMLLETARPDIEIEVVESRGNWQAIVRTVTEAEGAPRNSLGNVVVTSNTNDMREVYGRARVLLAPSLWWESGARVLAEAMLNGIPAVVTQRGGSPEMIGDAGIAVRFPDECYEPPYTKLPSLQMLQPLITYLINMYDDEEHYRQLVERALHVGRTRHGLAVNTRRLLDAFSPFVNNRRSGSG